MTKQPAAQPPVYKTANMYPVFAPERLCEDQNCQYYQRKWCCCDTAQPAPEAPAERFEQDTNGGTEEKR